MQKYFFSAKFIVIILRIFPEAVACRLCAKSPGDIDVVVVVVSTGGGGGVNKGDNVVLKKIQYINLI